MRPSIMRTADAAAYQTNQKYNYLRAQQISAGANGFGLLKEESAPLLPPIDELRDQNKPPEKPAETEADKQPEKTALNEYDDDFDDDFE